MADGYANATQAGLRAALVADPTLAGLVAGRVVDEPAPDILLPYVRFGVITPTPDDTDGAAGARVTVGLEVHSRPMVGRVEAQAICEAIWAALHQRPEVVTIAGYSVTEIECQVFSVTRAADGATYAGTLSLAVDLFG